MRAGQHRGATGFGHNLVQSGIDLSVQTYSLLLSLGLGIVTACLALGVMAAMGTFLLIFVTLLAISAWQAALPKIGEAIARHCRNSIKMLFTGVKEEVLDYLEACMRLLNGKSRLRHGSRQAAEVDDNGLPIPPSEFLCPLTHDIMSDPVTLLTGMTYDRHSIKKWIERGHTTCPMTQKQLSWRMHNQVFASRNYVLRHLIDAWVADNWPGKDPRTPLGPDGKDALVLFGLQAPHAQAAGTAANAATPSRHAAAESARYPGPVPPTPRMVAVRQPPATGTRRGAPSTTVWIHP